MSCCVLSHSPMRVLTRSEKNDVLSVTLSLTNCHTVVKQKIGRVKAGQTVHVTYKMLLELVAAHTLV